MLDRPQSLGEEIANSVTHGVALLASVIAGIAFYATDTRLRYGHALWHVFVVAGSGCHVVAVLWYAARRAAG
jgi:predicted membrane channel-forming protein YqfA (hemolysin III family)